MEQSLVEKIALGGKNWRVKVCLLADSEMSF
jgi:hypothetical protein